VISFFARVALMSLWMVACSVIGIVFAVVRWGDTNLDRDYARWLAGGILRIAGLRVQLEGAENLETARPCIYVANHQGIMDVATFGSIYPGRTITIGKRELLYIPFFGLFFAAAGNIAIDRQRSRSAIQSLAVAVRQIVERKVSVWIFPEGTRNRTGEGLLPFKKGAFHMAAQAGIPVVPCVSAPLHPLMHYPSRRMLGGTLRIRVLPPIWPRDSTPESVEALLTETRGKMLEALRSLGA
jgi:1-acyl-sn-glycerol-3-phosphate acyltransferase